MARGGRPYKGERRRLVTRVPLDVAAAVKKAAAEHGMTVNDYVTGVVREHAMAQEQKERTAA
ncbi:MAG: hypothetical protein M3N17_02135 [Actinomycetota bacterium]|nr:hypothetical protein [Actinomycetota bacterium]